MPAYTAVEENSGEYQGNVFFATSDINARRAAADQLNDGELGGLRVHRDKGLDKYEEQGWVPLEAMIWRGWWTTCTECGIEINSDLYEEEPEDEDALDMRGQEPCGMFDGVGFCCSACEAEWERKRYEEKSLSADTFAQLRGRVLAHFRDVEWRGVLPKGQNWGAGIYDKFYVGWKYDGDLEKNVPDAIDCTILFRVPGAKSWANCRINNGNVTMSFPPTEREIFAKSAKRALDSLLSDA